MKDFLAFLNTASTEELTAIPQITPALAEALITARPLSSVEEAQKVKGLTQKKLDNLRAAFESRNAAAEETSPAEITTPKKVAWGKVLWRVFIALLILAALFALVYFGVPWFKEKVLTPLQNNTQRVSELTSQQASDVQSLSTEIAALQERVTTLEARVDSIDQSIQAHTEALNNLEAMQTSLQTALDAHKAEIAAQVAEQLTLTRAIELLSRSRLYMSQSNFGLAKADAISARELLYGLLSTISADQAGALRTVISRLDLALTNIEAYPAIAVYDLDMAWRLLVDGLPNVPQAVMTPVVAETLPPTAIPQATVTPAP
jgi:Tfp pilus assembly protein PilO